MLPSLLPGFYSVFFSRCSLKKFPLKWYFLLEKKKDTFSCITTANKQFYCFCSHKSTSSTSWMLEKQPYGNKKDTFSFVPGFLECHPCQEVLEVCPGGIWEGVRRLPELPSHPRAPAKGKEGGMANVVKDYRSHPGWDWLKIWWLWEQKQNSASEQLPLMGWQLNPGEEQALMDLSVRAALHNVFMDTGFHQ